MEHIGLPVNELTDEELERQGSHAHATRNWVFLHGTAEQFERHTERMLELEQEYLRRHPKRTWQGTAAGATEVDEATRLRAALRGVVRQVESLLSDASFAVAASPEPPNSDKTVTLLRRIAHAPGGRMHKLEAHQAAREVGLDRISLARLYTADPPLLGTQQQDRVITEAGRALLDGRSDVQQPWQPRQTKPDPAARTDLARDLTRPDCQGVGDQRSSL